MSDLEQWLLQRGLHTSPDRLYQHIKNIQYLNELDKTKNTHILLNDVEKHREIGWSLVEAIELINIYKAVRKYESASLNTKIKNVLKGPTDPFSETLSSNIGRNTVFELNLAARLIENKLSVRLNKNPDILCSLDGRDILIQCKRPFVEKNIPMNISRAKKQLTRDLNNIANSRGVIAISISRACNKGDSLFIGKDETSMKIGLSEKAQLLGEECKRIWLRIVDTRIIGILFHVITPAYSEDIGLFSAMQSIVVFNLSLPNSWDAYTLQHFKTLLENNA